MAGLAAVALFGAANANAGTVVEPKLKIITEERYDDDALLRTENSLQLGGELMTKVTPEVGVNLKNRTLNVDAFYAPDFQVRHLSGTFRMDHRAGLDVTQRLSRRHEVFGHFKLWRVADPTSLPRMGVGRTLSPVLYGTGDVGLNAQVAERWVTSVHYRFEGTKIYDSTWPSGQVHAPTAELWYRLTERASVGAEYRFQYFIYGADQALANSPAATFRYRLSRYMTFNAKGGPVWFQSVTGAPEQGVAPRVHLELARNVDGFELGVQAGQDVIGASGFSSALWAQYAGLYSAFHLIGPLRFFGATYWYRNGAAPGTMDAYLGRTAGTQSGYAVSAGLEWRFDRRFMLQGQVDRIAQVGVYGPDADLSRNVAAIRLVVTAW